MPFNGSGTFTPYSPGNPVVTNTTISSTAFNNTINDIATGLSTAITKDGQTTATANLPMGGYKLTGLGAGSAATDSANLSQVQSGVVALLGSVAGTNTITAAGSPAVTAYASGQTFRFVPAATNTGATTINIDSLGAKNVYYRGAALAGGEIRSGVVAHVTYDGTQFNLVDSNGVFPAGTASAPAIVAAGDSNTGVFFPAADTVAVTTGGTERVRVDSAGNVGVGVTPSAWDSGWKALQLNANGVMFANGSNATYFANNYYLDGANAKYLTSNFATSYGQVSGAHIWYTAPSGTAGNTITFTTAMTLQADGYLLVGGTAYPTGINSSHMFKSSSNDWTMTAWNTNATPYGVYVLYDTAANNTSSSFLYCYDGSANRAAIRSNGGLANYQANDVNLSDLDLKPDFQTFEQLNYTQNAWSFGKAMRGAWGRYHYDDQTHDDWNNGYGAQLVKAAADAHGFPELVEYVKWGRDETETQEDGTVVVTKEAPMRYTVYDSDLMHIMGVCITEALHEIDALKAEVAALKAK